MSTIRISCPECQAVLKLKDRSLLGKTGQCPKCQHRFVLQETQTTAPQENPPVKFELVEEQAPVSPDQAAVGANPTWIPDTPAPVEPQTSPVDQLFSAPTDATAQEQNPLSFLQQESPPNMGELNVGAEQSATAPPMPVSDSHPSAPPRRKRRKRRQSGGWMTMLIILLVVGGGGAFLYQQMQSGQGIVIVKQKNEKAKPTPVAMQDNQSPPTAAVSTEDLPAVASAVEQKSPTAGQPIQLLHLPAGVRLVINLRPADLWSNQPRMAEFRASLGPLGKWLEEQIFTITRHEPQVIEELLIGIILGPQGVPPEWAAVVRFQEPQQRSEMLTTYAGQPYQEFNTDIQISNGQAFHFIDDQTVSICPQDYVEDVLQFDNTPALTANQIEKILEATDRERLFTLACDPDDLEIHLDMLFPETAHQAIEKTIRWLGNDAWAMAWSLHVADDFYTDIAILGEKTSRPYQLKSVYQERLNAIPELLLTSVQKMDPRRSGYRQIIGRFPAMMKVLSLTTAVAVDRQFIRMGSLLPAKAGPNLALGTLLTWDESTRTDFSQKSVVAQSPVVKEKTKTFAEKLQVKMDIDFRRTPLQEAFAYIAGESKIEIIVDGDALKLAGFTKNMPQTHKEDQMTTLAAIHAIVQKYAQENDPLAIHLDDKAETITVLTVNSAALKNLKTYPFEEFQQADQAE